MAASDQGQRSVEFAQAEASDAFGAGESPLALPFLNPGPLSDLSPEEQRCFVSSCCSGRCMDLVASSRQTNRPS